MATGLQIPQMGNSRTPSWTGMLPQVSRGMNPGEIAEMQYREQQTRSDQAEYQEYLRDQENRALERDIKRQQLEFQQGKAGEQMQQDYAARQMQFDTAAQERIADEFTGAVDDPNAYASTWTKYKELLGDKFPPQLMTQDGSMLPYEQAKPVVSAMRDDAVNTVAQQKAMDLANLKGYWAQQNSAGYTESADSPRQALAASARVRNFIDENKYDLGDPDKGDTTSRYLINTLSNVSNAVARMQSNRRGQGVNAAEVHSEILNIARDYITEKEGWLKVFKDDDFNKEEFEKRVSQHFGLAKTTLTEFRNDPDVKQSFSGPSKLVAGGTYANKEAVQKDIDAGKLKSGDKVILNGKPIILDLKD